MADVTGPTVVRRQLGKRLRRLRDAAGKRETDVESAKLASRAKLWRIESGKVPVKLADVWALCRFYGADEDTTRTLGELAEGTIGQGWSEDSPEGFGLYAGLETIATDIRAFNSELVHGLLQTPDYTHAVFRAARPDDGPEVTESGIRSRKERQSVLDRNPPPSITAVTSAAALTRMIGGAGVLRRQVDKLRDLNARDHITIMVLPWDAGAHAALAGAFTILDFDDPDDPAVVYLESHLRSQYLEDRTELNEYRRIFDLVLKQSLTIEEYQSEQAGERTLAEEQPQRGQRRGVRGNGAEPARRGARP